MNGWTLTRSTSSNAEWTRSNQRAVEWQDNAEYSHRPNWNPGVGVTLRRARAYQCWYSEHPIYPPKDPEQKSLQIQGMIITVLSGPPSRKYIVHYNVCNNETLFHFCYLILITPASFVDFHFNYSLCTNRSHIVTAQHVQALSKIQWKQP